MHVIESIIKPLWVEYKGENYTLDEELTACNNINPPIKTKEIKARMKQAVCVTVKTNDPCRPIILIYSKQ